MKNHIAYLKDARITALALGNLYRDKGNIIASEWFYDLDNFLAAAIKYLQTNNDSVLAEIEGKGDELS